MFFACVRIFLGIASCYISYTKGLPPRVDEALQYIRLVCFFSVTAYLPQRYVFGFMGFLAVANAYALRNVLNLAITEMVVHHHKESSKETVVVDPNGCPGTLEYKNHSDPVIQYL